MAAWSSILIRSTKKLNFPVNKILSYKTALSNENINLISVRNSGGGHKLYIRTSRYYWKKFTDLTYFYLTLGILPMIAVITYCNIFIGESELIPIPEGYVPERHEYYSHPITRFIAKYLPSKQQLFEMNCHKIFEENLKRQIILTRNMVQEKMKERSDYQAWYFTKPLAKYARIQDKIVQEAAWENMGNAPHLVVEDR